jgi:hypothetical protein
MPRHARLPATSPARLDIDVYRGDSITIRLWLKTHGVSMVIENWYFRAYVKAGIDDVDPITEFIINIFSPMTGEFRLALGGDQTAMLPEKCVWDLEAMDSVGRIRTILRGSVTVVPDVTNDPVFSRSGRGRGRA